MGATFFTNRETYLMMNGFMEEKIYLQQEVPQGDILSPLIFLLVVEFLLLNIGYTKTINGVFFPHGEARAEAYADDTTIGISRDSENLRNLIGIIKTHVIPIGLITNGRIPLPRLSIELDF